MIWVGLGVLLLGRGKLVAWIPPHEVEDILVSDPHDHFFTAQVKRKNIVDEFFEAGVSDSSLCFR